MAASAARTQRLAGIGGTGGQSDAGPDAHHVTVGEDRLGEGLLQAPYDWSRTATAVSKRSPTW